MSSRPSDSTGRLWLSVDVRPRETPVELRRLLRRVARTVLRDQGMTGRVRLSVHLVDDATIQRINAQHRGVDAPTDVLSFPQIEDSGFVSPPGAPVHLGDVVLSVPRVHVQAREFDHSVEREFGYLTAHGILHTLGYDHESDAERAGMRAYEEQAMVAVGLTR